MGLKESIVVDLVGSGHSKTRVLTAVISPTRGNICILIKALIVWEIVALVKKVFGT